MRAEYTFLNLIATVKKWKEKGKINFSNIFYLIQHIQNIIMSMCNH